MATYESFVPKASYVAMCEGIWYMRGIPVLEKYRYILYFKQYHIIIFLIPVFQKCLFRSSHVGDSASQIAAKLVNLTTELRDRSKQIKLYEHTRS